MWFSLSIEVIPAVDVLGDQSVRLEQGDYDRVVERAAEPVALARRWVDAGAGRVHLVDLDGARSGKIRPELVAAVAAAVRPALLQASGGIRTLDDARRLLDAGADRVIVGTAAWPDPEPWLELGAVIALDVRDGQVMGRGWTEGSGISLDDALARLGNARVHLTAIDRDGTLAGPDLEIVRRAAATGARVLAAGGVRSPEDVEALAAAGAEAAVVGRALLRGDER